ncbi:MAG: DNA-binding protein [Actinomycetota bacterium]|nr:DNA-binding protein [Actinomycetota bacterium]
MGRLREFVHRLVTPVDELQREELASFCEQMPTTSIVDVEPRQRVRLVGEIEYVRTVPRSGAPSLEVGITDGHDRVLAEFLGRRSVPGIQVGRRLIISGVAAPEGRIYRIVNPEYELLPSPARPDG